MPAAGAGFDGMATTTARTIHVPGAHRGIVLREPQLLVDQPRDHPADHHDLLPWRPRPSLLNRPDNQADGVAMTTAQAIRCAWCERVIRASQTSEDSHGICLDCLPATFAIPVESLQHLPQNQLDALPYGVIRLDENDCVLEFNHFEVNLARKRREDVLGKRFFVDVAPCTNVEQLGGWVRSARAAAVDAETQVMFVFRFPFGQRLVDLSLSFASASKTVTILVREAGAQDGKPLSA